MVSWRLDILQHFRSRSSRLTLFRPEKRGNVTSSSEVRIVQHEEESVLADWIYLEGVFDGREHSEIGDAFEAALTFVARNRFHQLFRELTKTLRHDVRGNPEGARHL